MAISDKNSKKSGFIGDLSERIKETGFWGGLVAFFGLASMIYGGVLFIGGIVHAFQVIWLWMLGLVLMVAGLLTIVLIARIGGARH